jgi:ABC-2 type transport system permease protein
MAIARETQFRANAIGTIMVGIAFIVVSILPVLLLFQFSEDVNGWSRNEVIALVGLFQMMTGLMETFIRPNMTRFTGLVSQGDLDPVLLRPISSQFYVTFRWISPASLFYVLAGGLLMLIGLFRAGVDPSIAEILLAVVISVCGMILLVCAWSALVYIVFWTISVSSIAQLFDDLWSAGGYPVVFFPTPIRIFLTLIFPVAFATTMPIDLLTGRGQWWQPVLALGATLLATMLIRIWWKYAIRSYASASS